MFRHPTSCCSAAEIMSTLFFYAMKYKADIPRDPANDRFVLSKVRLCKDFISCFSSTTTTAAAAAAAAATAAATATTTTTTTTDTILLPFFQDYPRETVPEETFTHLHLS